MARAALGPKPRGVDALNPVAYYENKNPANARRSGYTAILDDTRLGLIRLAYTEDWGKIVFVEIKALSSD
jgi:hypothetical protein